MGDSVLFHSRTTMVTEIFALLLVVQGSIAKAIQPECCGSKTVGEISYTLAGTTGPFPEECKESCAYTRDDYDEESLFCFAPGNLPVNCTEELCYPGPPGPTGCPADENLRIVNIPNTIGARPSPDDCRDYCRALCPPDIWPCLCSAWTYNTYYQMCSTFYTLVEPACFDAVFEEGWISGSTCFDTNTEEIKEIPSIAGNSTPNVFTFGPYGKLPGQNIKFDDNKPNIVYGPVTAVHMFEGKYGVYENVIVGIQFEYQGIPAPIHGNPNGNKISMKAETGIHFTDITVNSIQNSPQPANNLIYYLQFTTSDGQTTSAGTPNVGTATTIPTSGKGTSPIYISGYVLPKDISQNRKDQMLGQLNFIYQ